MRGDYIHRCKGSLVKKYWIIAGLAATALLGAWSFIYLGVFNVAADEHHSKPVLRFLEVVREHSIHNRARDIEIPPLNEPEMLMAGGADYNEMCSGCHLKPGTTNSELRSAMYPQPPDLTRVKRDSPAETFWIIKHGIKMSGMPAWGATHDDARIWAMVAFLQQLPRLTPDQYQILTARGDGDGGHEGHEGHEGHD